MVVKLYEIQMIWKRCGFAVYFLRRCFWRVQHATSYSSVGQHDADASCLIWIFKIQTIPFHFYNPLKFNKGQREWKSEWLGCIRIWVLHWFQLMLINAIQCHSIQLRVVAVRSQKASCVGCCWNWEVDNWSPAQDCCPRDKNVVLCCWKNGISGEFLQGVVLNVLVQTMIFKECVSSSTTTCLNLSVINLLMKNEPYNVAGNYIPG